MIETLGIQPDWQAGDLRQMPTLAPGELHVWWLPLSLDQHKQNLAQDLLSDIQRDKYIRRRTEELKLAYLAGRYYLLTLLGAYVGVEPGEIKLSYSRLNKPYLSNNASGIHFNFTDTQSTNGSVGAFVFSRHHEVGIDIEARSRKCDFAAISNSRFTPAELDFATTDGVVNAEKFLAIWTRKEAFGKATGKGINFKMNQQNLSSGTDFELDFLDNQDQPWRLQQLEFGDELIVSVVHEGHQKLETRAFHCLRT